MSIERIVERIEKYEPYWQRFREWLTDKKFNSVVTGIFFCIVIVSFSDTYELYRSVFDRPASVLGIPVNRALFATIAIEASFTVGLWGLYEAFREERGFKLRWRHVPMWLLLIAGALIVGWSNISGTNGLDFIFGKPYKGTILGLSIPIFLVLAVIVNFTRKPASQNANRTSENDNKRNTNRFANVAFENATSQIANSQNTYYQIANVQFENSHSQIANVVSETSNSQFTNATFESATSQTADVKCESADPQITNTQSEVPRIVKVTSEGAASQITNAESESTNSKISDAGSETADSQITNETSQNANSQISNENSQSATSQIANVGSENEKSQIANPQNADAQKLFEKYAAQIASENKEEVRHAMKHAIEYHAENGKFPTIEGLAQIAGVSDWHARLALSKLRGKAKKRRKAV